MTTTKKIINAAKELLEEQISSYIEPSERKVRSAKKQVEAAKQDLKNAVNKVRVASEDWKKFRKESEGKITNNKTAINDFRKRMNKSGIKGKTKYEEKLNELEQKNKKIMMKIGKYKDERKEQWESFKSIFARDIEEIGSSLKDLSKAFLK